MIPRINPNNTRVHTAWLLPTVLGQMSDYIMMSSLVSFFFPIIHTVTLKSFMS